MYTIYSDISLYQIVRQAVYQWQHVEDLYERNKGRSCDNGSGLYLVKLTYEHIH